MKKNIITVLFFAVLCVVGCKSQNGGNDSSAAGHTHSESCTHSHEGHSHEGHSHDAPSHEAHNHSEHKHNHSEQSHDAHSHDAHGHDEGLHAGEIKFSKAQAEAVGLETEIVTPAPFRGVIHTGGQFRNLQGSEENIVATTSGVLYYSNPSISEGTYIAKGEKIASVSARHLQDGDPVVKAKVAFETAEKEFHRAEKLVADKIISEKDFEQAKLNYETAKASYEGQAANLSEQGVSLKSKAAGYVSRIIVGQGEYVSVGQIVAKLVSNNKMQLVSDLPEGHFKDLGKIHDANFQAAYDFEVYNVKALKGRLVSCGRVASEGSAYIPVTFEFENRGGFIPGSFAEVWLLSDSREDALSVPVGALSEDQGVFAVFVRLEEEIFKRQEVTIGHSNGQRVEILAGLRGGEEVVVRGTHQVKLASASTAIPGHTHNH